MIFTFIPLTLMAGAAYLRARSLLRDQVVGQMQAQLTTQVAQVDLTIKTKEIRLDRLVVGAGSTNEIGAALATNSQSQAFAAMRNQITSEVRSINPAAGRSTFNQFLLLASDGTVHMASNPKWEGVALQNAAFYKTLVNNNHQSYALFDAAPLFPGQLVLMTISQYHGAGGAPSGTLVGITESDELQGILRNLVNLNPAAAAFFAEPDGTLIGSDPYTNQIATVQPSTPQKNLIVVSIDEMMNSQINAPQTIEYSDEKGIASIAQVSWLDSLHAGVVYEIPQSTIFGPLSSLVPFTIGIFVISLLAMAVVLYLGANRVFRPLEKLSEITRRFAAGDFSQRAEAGSRDEIGWLAQSFNQMAEELSTLYHSLEQKVDERTRQIRIAAEVAQQITSTTDLNELLNRTVQMIVEQFNFYQASIFMLDRGGRFAVLTASHGPAAQAMLARGHRLETGSTSIIGWVSANNQPRIASNVEDDSVHLKNELLPETRSEVGIPISVGKLVLGALDVQSAEADAFGPETIVTLQILASQIAVAIQNVGLVASTQVNFQELERLQRASRQIASAKTGSEAFQTTTRMLVDAPYPALVLSVHGKKIQIEGYSEVSQEDALRVQTAVRNLEADLEAAERFLSGNPLIVEAGSFQLPGPFQHFTRGMDYKSAAFLPIMSENRLAGLITLGGTKQNSHQRARSTVCEYGRPARDHLG